MNEDTRVLAPNGRPAGKVRVPRRPVDGSCPECGASGNKRHPVLGGGPAICTECGYQENGERNG